MRESRPRVVIAGGTGLIGRALIHAFAGKSDVVVLSRRAEAHSPQGSRARQWAPDAQHQKNEAALAALADTLEGAEAVINLAGASLADGRMQASHRHRILASRVHATETLLAAARRCDTPPRVWLQASAVGIYGDGGDTQFTETSPPGNQTFLAEVCRAWEQAAAGVKELTPTPRSVTMRFGVVLAAQAPAWQKLLQPIRFGVGGRLGSGNQWMPWIHIDDLAGAVWHLYRNAQCSGIYNITAPHPVRQRDMVAAIAKAMGRPAWLPAPAWALRLALGRVADELLLAGQRALPQRLQDAGYRFTYPHLTQAVEALLGR